ncbi:MAG: aminopeptidase P family protein [Bacteroidales bacterium]|nr:aminopeptidase P family protein [Bacteroidales bacterium]
MDGNIFRERIEAARALMRSNNWDILILTGGDPHQSEYPAPRWQQVPWLSGFTGEAGDLVITADHAGLWTDTRYFIQANRQLAGSGVELHKMRVPEQVPIPQWIASLGLDEPTIAVDALCQSVSAVRELQDAVPSAIIVPVPDLIGPLWQERPAIPSTPVITLGEDIVGESREAKIGRLRKWLVLQGADAILLTALDDIAWLLNVRGQDIDYNPFVISYLLVSLEEVQWFVRKDAFEDPDPETAASFEELEADGISIRDYSDIDFTLASLRLDGVDRICVDPSGINYALRDAIDDGDLLPEVIETGSPVPLWKAVKNSVEIEGMREAHLEDGLAMEQFLYWLSCNAGRITEWEAACELGRLRARIPGYRGDSFQTISAYGEGAALPHYITPLEGSSLLEARGLYLVDSGGQYLFGTTDVTRTVPLGPCTPLEKEDYTLVLKGHIDLAMAVFPAGTAVCQIDALARGPLWRAHRNFGHGTGHGVGFFLGVHEGPQDIRQNFNSQALLPGMVVSDEPGIYREGMHGVRHENLLLVRRLGDNEFGSWLGFETLTLCHFDISCLDVSLLDADEIAWLNAYNCRVYETLAPRLPGEIAAWLREKTRPV